MSNKNRSAAISEAILLRLHQSRKTVKGLADHIKVHPTTLNSWLIRHRNIPLQYILDIALFLECDLAALLKGEIVLTGDFNEQEKPTQTPNFTAIQEERLRELIREEQIEWASGKTAELVSLIREAWSKGDEPTLAQYCNRGSD